MSALLIPLGVALYVIAGSRMCFTIATLFAPHFDEQTAAFLTRFAFALFPSAFVPMGFLAIAMFTDRKNKQRAALGVALGAFVLVLWAAFVEFNRLNQAALRGHAWRDVLPFLDPFVLGGCVLSLFLGLFALRFAILGTFTSKRAKAEPKRAKKPIFGDADWMSMKDAGELFPDGPGVVIGERYRPDRDPSAGPIFDPGDRSSWGRGGTEPVLCYRGNFGSTHGLIFAGSGGFKTTSTVIPTCLRWPGPIVLLDPSREVLPMIQAERERIGRKVCALDPNEFRDGFDVLDWIPSSKSPEESIAATIDWLFPDASSGSSADDFFRTSARQLLTGLLADIVLSDDGTYPERSLRQLREALARPAEEFQKSLEEIHQRAQNPFVKETIGPFVGMVDKTFAGVFAGASKETQWLSFARLARLVSEPSFASSDLKSGGVDVAINLDLKTLSSHPGVGRLIVGALLNALYEADGDVEQRVLFLLDEAATLGAMDIVRTARDAGRKYGISLLMIYQSIGQLEKAWGQGAKSAWFESVSFRSFAAISDQATAEDISKTCGEFSVETVSTNRKGAGLMTKTSRGTSTQKRPLILPHEILAGMRRDEQITFVAGRPPLRSGRALYFRRDDMNEAVDPNRFARKSA